MFVATWERAGTLKKIVAALKELISEANFECTSAGIHVSQMDSANVALVDLMLRASGFESYRCDVATVFGLSIDSVAMLLKFASNDAPATLSFKEGDTSVDIQFGNASGDSQSNFTLHCMDIDQQNVNAGDIKFSAVVKMASAQFQHVCRDMEIISDSINIKASVEGIEFSSEGDMSKGNVLFRPSDHQITEVTVLGPYAETRASFAQKYLAKFSKASSLSDTVTLSLVRQMPLAVEFDIEDGDARLCYYLAPKFDDI
jgi:proliferating cell nuclear antigen